MRRLARTSSVPVKRFRATPEAWIAPSASRELRELVRHRAKLVRLRSSLKCQRHDSGYARCRPSPAWARPWARSPSPRSAMCAGFRGPTQLTSWAGLTPRHPGIRHRRARWADHQAGVPAGSLGRDRGGAARWHRHPDRRLPGAGRRTPRPQPGQGRRRPRARRVRVLRASRRTRSPASSSCSSSNNVQCSTRSSRSIGRAGPRPVILPQPDPAAAHLCRPRPTFEIDASWAWRHVPYRHNPTRRPTPARSCPCWWWPAGCRPG